MGTSVLPRLAFYIILYLQKQMYSARGYTPHSLINRITKVLESGPISTIELSTELTIEIESSLPPFRPRTQTIEVSDLKHIIKNTRDFQFLGPDNERDRVCLRYLKEELEPHTYTFDQEALEKLIEHFTEAEWNYLDSRREHHLSVYSKPYDAESRFLKIVLDIFELKEGSE